MNKKMIAVWIVLLSVVIGLGTFVIIRRVRGIEQNPPDTVGNTGGNLNNGGYFCETADAIYFANFYDDGTLYRMNPDRTDIRKVNSAAVSYLNNGGNYLYYYQLNSLAASSLGFVARVSGLYRSNLNGGQVLCLDKVDCDRVVLVGNDIYYTKAVDGQDTLCLHRVSTDKKRLTQLTDYLLNPSSAANGVIYYNGTKEDHYLYAYDTATDLSTLVAEYQMWFPVYENGNIYFLDLSHNYRLCRLSLSDGALTVLTGDRVECFNVSGGYVYYQTTDAEDPALYMTVAGGEPVRLADGVYHNINIAGGYVYFTGFQTNIPMYTAPLGSAQVSAFDDAKTVALQEMAK